KEEEQNDKVFKLVINCLNHLNTSSTKPKFVLIFFTIWILQYAGYPISTGECPICNISLSVKNSGLLFTKSYGIVCGDCSRKINNIEKIEPFLINFLLSCLVEKLESIEKFELTILQTNKIISVLEAYISYHLGEFSKFKSILI
ncbi:MAG: DNA repair protein RecO, partial [Ignavibacteria bacterium]|nr:DNA repair protein RecO [Ignavibacteria bacterium]